MLEIENHIPKENHYVSLLFEEGYWTVQIIRKQQTTRYAPYWFNSGTAIANGATSGWTAPSDANGRYYLEPQRRGNCLSDFYRNHTKSGKTVPSIYTKRGQNEPIVPRPVPGLIGFWDGELSPYRNPSPSTELWTVHDLYPHMNVENVPMTGASMQIGASFWITPFTYKVLPGIKPEDKAKILRFLRGERPCTVRTMGDGDRPIKAPFWLVSRYSKDMVQPEEV